MGIENDEKQEVRAAKKNKYVVKVRFDDKLLTTYIKFINRVKNPRVTLYMVTIGAMLFALPFIRDDIKMAGVIVSYVMGPLLLFLGLFRDKISLHMTKNAPGFKVNEEIKYEFGNTGIEAVKSSGAEYMGNYKKIFRLWEDEKTFYVNMNEDDLIVLPKMNFIEGDSDTFKEFILDKSRAEFKWKPARIDNQIKWMVTQRKFRTWLKEKQDKKEKK